MSFFLRVATMGFYLYSEIIDLHIEVLLLVTINIHRDRMVCVQIQAMSPCHLLAVLANLGLGCLEIGRASCRERV